MNCDKLRLVINKISEIRNEEGQNEIVLSQHTRIMRVLELVSRCEASNRVSNFAVVLAQEKQFVDLVFEILELHGAIIEVGKHRNTFPSFVKERAEWKTKKDINVTLMLFVVAQKMLTIPNYFFRTELFGCALGMLYGYLDTINCPIEELIDDRLKLNTLIIS